MGLGDDRIIRWVQLTDLHFYESTVQNLQEDFLQSLEGISFAVVTGDLKQYADNYDRTIDFLTKIKEGNKLGDGCLFLVPGNHDITDFDDRGKYIQEIDKMIWNEPDCYIKYRGILTDAYTSYLEMSNNIVGVGYYQKEDMLYSEKTWDNMLNVLHINTSLLCDENSDKKQIIDTYGLSKLKPNGLPTIIIMHHDFYSLHGKHQEILKRIMQKLNVKACLSGHAHQISERKIVLPDNSAIPNFVSGKTLSQPDDHGSDSSIIVYGWNQDTNIVTAKPYKWSIHRFTPSFDFNTDIESERAIHGVSFSFKGNSNAKNYSRYNNATLGILNFFVKSNEGGQEPGLPPEFDETIRECNKTLRKAQNKVRIYSWAELDFDSIYILPYLSHTSNPGEGRIHGFSPTTPEEGSLMEGNPSEAPGLSNNNSDASIESNLLDAGTYSPKGRSHLVIGLGGNSVPILGKKVYNENMGHSIFFSSNASGLLGSTLFQGYKTVHEQSLAGRNEWISNIFCIHGIVYVIGGAGYGKSLFLKNLSVNPQILNGFEENALLIIRGDIKRIIRPDGTFKPMIEFLEECFTNSSLRKPNELHDDFLTKCLSAGRCLVLLDALDEVGNDQRNELHNLIVSYFEDTYPDNKVCITSRERGFIPREDIMCYYIMPVTLCDVGEYVDRFIKLDKFNADEKERFVKQAAKLVSGGFVKGFLTLSLLLAIYKNEQELPTNKVLLYEKCFEYIANIREKGKKLMRNSSTGEEYDWGVLAKLMNDATFMELAQIGTPNNTDIKASQIDGLMLSLYERRFHSATECKIATEMFLQFCADRTEIFVPSPNSNTEYRFFHRSFYEYFFAKFIEARTNDVVETYARLRDFDVDSEVFELLITLYERRNPYYLRDLISYAFANAEGLLQNNNDGLQRSIDILVMMMQVVDEKDFLERFTMLFLNEGGRISGLPLAVDFNLIGTAMTRNMDFFTTYFDENRKHFLTKVREGIVTFILKNKPYCNNILKPLKKSKQPFVTIDDIKSQKGFTYPKLLTLLPDSWELMEQYFEKFADKKHLLLTENLRKQALNDLFVFAGKVNALSSKERNRVYNSILAKA